MPTRRPRPPGTMRRMDTVDATSTSGLAALTDRARALADTRRRRLLGISFRPEASPLWRNGWPRPWTGAPPSSRWTASTWPPPSWTASAAPTARARPTPSTRPGTWPCCGGCGPRTRCTRSTPRPSTGPWRSRWRARCPWRRTSPLVITEGNYLLLDDGPWAPVRGLLDEVWFLELDPGTRVRRLVDRHVRHGRPRREAEEWVARSDEANARLVERGRDRADLVVRLTPAA